MFGFDIVNVTAYTGVWTFQKWPTSRPTRELTKTRVGVPVELGILCNCILFLHRLESSTFNKILSVQLFTFSTKQHLATFKSDFEFSPVWSHALPFDNYMSMGKASLHETARPRAIAILPERSCQYSHFYVLSEIKIVVTFNLLIYINIFCICPCSCPWAWAWACSFILTA